MIVAINRAHTVMAQGATVAEVEALIGYDKMPTKKKLHIALTHERYLPILNKEHGNG